MPGKRCSEVCDTCCITVVTLWAASAWVVVGGGNFPASAGPISRGPLQHFRQLQLGLLHLLGYCLPPGVVPFSMAF